MAAVCIFCGQQSGNREHIVAAWMLRDLGLYQQKFRIGFGLQAEDGHMDEIDAPQPLGSFITDEICPACNNGWMSRLEDSVKPLLTPLLQETWTNDDRPLFQSLFVHSHILAQWLLKTACTFGIKMSVTVPQDIRKDLLQSRVSPEIMADLSINQESGLYIGMSREWNVFKEGKLDCMRCEGRSFRFVWQVRHLAMRVVYFPGCEKNMSRPRFPVKLYPRFGILPDYHQGGTSRRSYHYATLEQLEHETTYFFGGNPNNPRSSLPASHTSATTTIRAKEPAPGKACDSCTLCCKVLGITALRKPHGTWCVHCTQAVGCQIYAARPEECRAFVCLWLLDPDLPPEWKPDRSHLVVTPDGNGNGLAVHCDPGFPNAWRQEPYRSKLHEWAVAARPHDGTVMVSTASTTTLIAPEGEFPLGKVQDDDRIVSEFTGPRLTAVRLQRKTNSDSLNHKP